MSLCYIINYVVEKLVYIILKDIFMTVFTGSVFPCTKYFYLLCLQTKYVLIFSDMINDFGAQLKMSYEELNFFSGSIDHHHVEI